LKTAVCSLLLLLLLLLLLPLLSDRPIGEVALENATYGSYRSPTDADAAAMQ